MKSDTPKNGFELAKSLDLPLDTGVVVALFPDKVEEVKLTAEAFPPEQAGVIGELGPWGTRLLDVVTEKEDGIKWWKVKQFAKTNGYDLLPVRWEGAISDIPERYFNEGTILGVRLYEMGPWFWPLEEPVVQTEEQTELEHAVNTLNRRHGYE